MSEHTPGPWVCNLETYEISTAISDTVMFAEDRADDPTDEDFANARLIAAAPEMLEALEMVYGRLMDYPEAQRMNPQFDWVGFSVATAKRIGYTIASVKGLPFE